MESTTTPYASLGYLRTSHALNRAFNIVLALLLLILSAPVMVVIALIIWITDGSPIIYRGTRLGRHKSHFTMFKFRTLVRNAEEQVGARLLGGRNNLTTPFGRFLRETRLDELLQLFNILRGEMDFVGPRPVRPAVYEQVCRNIPNYDERFRTNPGLIGFSQLYTPHGAPKRIRSYIDNRLVRKKQMLFYDVWIVFLTGLVVLRTTFVQMGRYFWRVVLCSKILRRYRQRRDLERVRVEEFSVRFGQDGASDWLPFSGSLVDINDEAFLLRCERPLEEPFPGRFCIEGYVRRATRSRRKKRALCDGAVYRYTVREPGVHEYVVMYKPVTPLNAYFIQQYFLRESVV